MKTFSVLAIAIASTLFLSTPVMADASSQATASNNIEVISHQPKSATCAKQRHQSMSLRCRFEK